MKLMKYLLALGICSTLLTACGSDSDKQDSPDRATIPSPEIAGFSVSSAAPAQPGVIPINAGIEDGKFTIDWNVTSANSFHLKIYLSHDETPSSDDIRIFNNSLCGAVRVNDCFAEDKYECQFGTDNTLKCTDGWESFNKNLNSIGFLTGLPQQAYIIGEACVIADCKTSAIKVEFQ